MECIRILDTIQSVPTFRCVSEIEVIEAMSRVKSWSVFVDGITIKFIRIIFPYISSILVDLFNCILTTSTCPTAWKNALVVPIPKTRVIHEPNGLRPISILVEHIMRDQILFSCSNIICDSQYAFRCGLNTSRLLLKLNDSVRDDINQDRLSVLVSLDLSKAFNSVDYAQLIVDCKASRCI